MVSLFPQSKKAIFLEIKEGMPMDPFTMSEASPISGTKEEGFSPVYRNKRSQEGLISTPHPSITTLKHVFDVGKANFPSSKCIGVRKVQTDGSFGAYEWESYLEIDEIQKRFGAGVFFILQNNPYITNSESHSKILSHRHVVQDRDMSFILTIYSHNRREWCITDLACSEYSITNTSLYDTLGQDTAQHILGLTESPIVVCSKDKIEQVIVLKENSPNQLASLIAVVLMDPLCQLDDILMQRAKSAKIVLYDFDQVTELGRLSPISPEHPRAETIYTISFTSGTTSMPKGVVLTHGNAVAGVTFCLSNLKIRDEPRFYCFLPLAHIYQRMVSNYAYLIGSAMGMPQSGSPLALIDDVKALKPHSLALVPRVFTKLEAALKTQTINNTERPILQKLFTNAIRTKAEMMLQADGSEGRHMFYDPLIGLLRKKVGFTNVVSVSSGSAPISVETVKFLKATLNVGFSQGYGLTESFAGVCGSLPYEADPGSCGPISITTEIKLRDLPEMNYTSEDAGGPRGELMLRGPQIFKEYYKDPGETAKVKDAEGWFSTGDVARVDGSTGRIFIVDRVKNFFKIAQGEYITPEKIENTYLSACLLLSQILVYGDSFKTYLVSIVGVEPDTIRPWIQKNFNQTISSNDDIIQFMNANEVKVRFLKEMNAAVGNALHGFERVHNISIDIEPMKIVDDIITPTMKIKRVKASKFFLHEFDKMYEEGSLLRNQDTKL